MYLARAFLQNAYVIESDLFLNNASLISKYQYESNYLGVPTAHTDDWCFLTDENGDICEFGIGADNCFHMFGISYLDSEAGRTLCEDIRVLYDSDPDCHSHFWDEVALTYCKSNYHIKVRPCTFADVTEIDTLDELIAMDASYERYKKA